MALARALVTGAPDAGDAAFWDALGIPSDMREGIVQSAAVTEIWPENLEAFNVFSTMQTQWRIGMGGPTGFDYGVLPVVMEMSGIAMLDRSEIFDAIRVMESEALKVFSENRERK
jgi:hypothetical protein